MADDTDEIEEIDGVSASVSFYFQDKPSPVPDFLAGHEGKNRKGTTYGFTLRFREADWDLRTGRLNEFLAEHLLLAEGHGVSPEWLTARRCRLRVYISLHPNYGLCDIEIQPPVLGMISRLGAELRLDSI